MMRPSLLAFTGFVFISAAPLAAITAGQVDTFQDGTTQGWAEGFVSPNPPINVSTGGPTGAGDRYLQNISSGGLGAGSRMIMFNGAQWAGDYVAAGITRIEADMANFGSTGLDMRIALAGYASTTAAVLPPDGQWRRIIFDLGAGSLTNLGSADPLTTALSSVAELRILSSPTPDSNGSALEGVLGVDNISAVPEPISALLLGLGSLLGTRQRRQLLP